MTDLREACSTAHSGSQEECVESIEPEWVRLCEAADVENAGALRIESDGLEALVVFHDDGTFFDSVAICARPL